MKGFAIDSKSIQLEIKIQRMFVALTQLSFPDRKNAAWAVSRGMFVSKVHLYVRVLKKTYQPQLMHRNNNFRSFPKSL